MPGTREEREHIHLFCTQTSKSLSGFFHSDLWLYYLPQLSQSEPAVRHAVAAVSATHKRLLGSSATTDDGQVEPFVLEQYNKAIRSLVPAGVQPRHPTPNLTLITCCLFICLETMKGNHSLAMDHAEAGLRILCRREQTNNDESEIPENVDGELSGFFSRMNLERSFFGRAMIPYKLELEESTKARVQFENISQARESLTRLLTLIFPLVRRIRMATYQADLSEIETQEFSHKQEILKQESKTWMIAFQQLRKRLAKTKKRSDTEERAPLVLLVQFLTAWILIHTCLASDEMIYDQFNTEFEELVAAAEQISRLTTPAMQQTESFSLETYAVGSLYWTARMCRHPIIRRRAIAALDTYPRKEGFWANRMDYAVAKYNMELEEASLVYLPVEQRVPEDGHRFFDTQVRDETVNNPCQVFFLSRPEHLGDDWKHRMEYVKW